MEASPPCQLSATWQSWKSQSSRGKCRRGRLLVEGGRHEVLAWFGGSRQRESNIHWLQSPCNNRRQSGMLPKDRQHPDR